MTAWKRCSVFNDVGFKVVVKWRWKREREERVSIQFGDCWSKALVVCIVEGWCGIHQVGATYLYGNRLLLLIIPNVRRDHGVGSCGSESGRRCPTFVRVRGVVVRQLGLWYGRYGYACGRVVHLCGVIKLYSKSL